MSHSVTIRTQTVTTGHSSHALIINSVYLRSWGGILKLLQLALGAACVGIMGSEFNTYTYRPTGDLFFLLITTTFMISTCILLLSYITSISTESIIGKTIYELLYHSIGFGLILAASLTLLVQVTNQRRSREYELLLGAAICGLVNSALYLLSTIFAIRSYRGL